SGNVLTSEQVRAGGWYTPLTADDAVYQRHFGSMPLGDYYNGVNTNGWSARPDHFAGTIGLKPSFDALNPALTSFEARTTNLLGAFHNLELLKEHYNIKLADFPNNKPAIAAELVDIIKTREHYNIKLADFPNNKPAIAAELVDIIKTGHAPSAAGIDFSHFQYFT